MRAAKGLLLGILMLGGCELGTWGQDAPAAPQKTEGDATQMFYLSNISQTNEAMDIMSGLRNMLSPHAKIFLVPSQNAIILRASPEDVALTRKILSDLDRTRRTYRLTYTITEFDGGKHVGTQHFSMVVMAGQRTTMKQGSKVPVFTGSFNKGDAGTQTDMTYLDVGLNFDVSLDESSTGVRLRSKAEQSSVAEMPGVGGDPVVRQTVLEGTSILTPGKPMVLGSLDIPGTTRHEDVEVVMEIVP